MAVAAVVSGIAGVAVTPAAFADGLDSFRMQKVEWKPCEQELTKDAPGLECATVEVPMNYANPAGERIKVAISRTKADPGQRRGILFTNPGGPGGEGRSLPGTLKDQKVSKVYDVIGMDPRGLGASTQLTCEAVQSPPLPSRPKDDQLAAFGDAARAQEEACKRGGGAFRPHVTSMNTARDVDVIRAALGEKKLNYLGYSYGTFLGSLYGTLFPEHLDRSVLDSSMDPTKTWHEQDYDTVRSLEANLQGWQRWVAERNKAFGLGTQPAEVHAALDEISAALEKRPVADIKSVDELDTLVGEATRYRKTWARFAEDVRKVRDEVRGGKPDPAVAKEFAAAAHGAQEIADKDKPSNGVYPAVTCDWNWPTNLDSYYQEMRKQRDKMPYGPALSFLSPTNCAFRSAARPEPMPQIKREGPPAGLVIQAEGDTQTAYPNGVMMARVLGNRLISVPGSGDHGHFAMRKPNVCVNELVNRYLVDGDLPNQDTQCQGTDKPKDIPNDSGNGTPGTGGDESLATLFIQIETEETYIY